MKVYQHLGALVILAGCTTNIIEVKLDTRHVETREPYNVSARPTDLTLDPIPPGFECPKFVLPSFDQLPPSPNHLFEKPDLPNEVIIDKLVLHIEQLRKAMGMNTTRLQKSYQAYLKKCKN